MRSTLQSLKARRGQNEKGFTLIELLVVVVIIGILIAIAIPLYLNYQKGAHNKAAESDVRNAISVMEQCYSDDGSYPDLTADVVLTANGTVGACTRTVSVSENTTLTFSAGTGGGYKITGTNSDGDKTYEYDSGVGGPVSES
jgi:type IV pilus assembly protein PilA